VDFRRHLRHTDSYTNTNTNSDTDSHTNPYANTDTHSNAYSNADTDTSLKLCRLCCRNFVRAESGCHQWWRLLPMYRARLVLFYFGNLLRARYRNGMDFGVDCSDGGFVQWYSDAYSDTDAYSHTNPDSYANPNTYANANADTYANSGAKFRVQPIQGRHSQYQLEHRCYAERGQRYDLAYHQFNAIAQ
jgi:hypothetical protein